MDRSLINLRASSEYFDGVANFIEITTNYLDEEGKTRYPCSNCVNINWNILDVIECHFYKYSMFSTCSRWIFHRDTVDLSPFFKSNSRFLGVTFSNLSKFREENANLRKNSGFGDTMDDKMLEMIHDLHGPMFEETKRESTEQDESDRISDARNVKLALASDGFNSFGNMSTSYSIWQVILIPYNLPPWNCMKAPFTFLSLLIPGSSSPSKEINIYLQPLIDEVNELWVDGIQTYDSFRASFFQLHVALLWK
ncbi:uncharacterized protein LOC127149371 [Cucumis melo]|uniref:Uncharacterized protein LOC127149371 n=1 Tax=Cucumis melo TaxID=3656 RepID=A0ABM3KRX4_CUCME|nr:uncharacterized protein LOC127149371 [Cucumis melo]